MAELWLKRWLGFFKHKRDLHILVQFINKKVAVIVHTTGWPQLYCMLNVWLCWVVLQNKLPLSYCLFTWIKYFWASAAVIYSIQLFSLSDRSSTLTGLQQRLVAAGLRSLSNFPASSSCISVQALLNIPLFHMLLLRRLSSTLWLYESRMTYSCWWIFLVYSLICLFPQSALTGCGPVVPQHPATCLSHATANATCPAAMIPCLYKRGRPGV